MFFFVSPKDWHHELPPKGQAREYLGLPVSVAILCDFGVAETVADAGLKRARHLLVTEQNKKSFWKKEVKCEFRLNTEFFMFFFVVTDVKLLQFLCFPLSLHLFVVVSIPRLGRGLTPQYASPEMIATNSMEFWQARKGGTHFFGMQVVVISRPWKSSQTAKSKKFRKCVA